MVERNCRARALLEGVCAGDTQVMVADRIDISPSALSHILHGKRLPSLAVAVRIERAYSIRCRAWFDDVQEEVGPLR